MPHNGTARKTWDPRILLSDGQREQLRFFEKELLRFNRRHNVISRDTEAGFAERHVLHSLALARRRFPAGAVVVDWGTGGGLPAIPLAIAFPEVEIHAVEAVRKKIHVVRALQRRLGLDNLVAWHGRAEAWQGHAHYSVSRATASLLQLWEWHERVRVLCPGAEAGSLWQPGVICLKGGDLSSEAAALSTSYPSVRMRITSLAALGDSESFAEKVIVEVTDPSVTGALLASVPYE